MRRIPLALLMLLALVATASAQEVFKAVPPPPAPPPPNTQPQAKPEDVVARLMSFDWNGDGKVTKDEVFERMENVVVDGDADHDGALDRTEIRAIAERPPAQSAVRGFQAGRYAFGDESGASSRLRIDGALDDLRLASAQKAAATAIVTTFMDALEKEASTDLLKEMENLLTPQQLKSLADAVNRRSQIRAMPQGNNVKAAAMLIFFSVDGRAIGVLTPLQAQQSLAVPAIERFNQRLLPGDAERTALLEKLRGVLNDEQREDFGAALQRRPVIKAGGGIVAGGVVGAVRAVDVQANPRVVVAGP